MKTHTMTIAEYETLLRRQVDEFFVHWKEKNKRRPDVYPLYYTSGSKTGVLLDWEDAFRVWQDNQTEEN